MGQYFKEDSISFEKVKETWHSLHNKHVHMNSLVEKHMEIETADGTADCYFVHPRTGAYPGVILWPDIMGLRRTTELMGNRLAESGYAVLVVNPVYRHASAPIVPDGSSFKDKRVRNTVYELMGHLGSVTTSRDTVDFVKFLDEQDSVNIESRISSVGYSMGGHLAMMAAAASTRIGVGAAIYGARLVTDGPESPHLLIPNLDARFLFAIAEDDDERIPEVKQVLRKAFDDSHNDVEITVYKDTKHGWCVPDTAQYDEVKAEEVWVQLLSFLKS